MSKLTNLMLLFLCSISLQSFACLQDGFTFNSQQKIDNFAINYPGCTSIEGNVLINGADITNLDGLSQITQFEGDVTLRLMDLLVDFSGLENVQAIGGRLYIDNNDALQDISALNNLTYVGEDLTVRICDALTNLDGLNNVVYVGGKLYLDQNDALTSIEGLSNLQETGGDLTIRICDELTNLNGLEKVHTVGGKLYLDQNYSLNDITGLDGLITIGEELTIRICPFLEQLYGLENLQTIGGKLYLDQNDDLINLQGLNNLSWVGDNISIRFCNSMINMSGLDNLTAIGGSISIDNNESLINLNGFESLIEIDGYIYIDQNDFIENLCGIQNINPNTINSYDGHSDIGITWNPYLSDCSVQSIYATLLLPGMDISIYQNMDGCNSQEEVVENFIGTFDACVVTTGVVDIEPKLTLNLFPNPASTHFTLTTEGINMIDARISIIDMSGKLIYQNDLNTNAKAFQIDTSFMESGIYIVQVQTREGKESVKRISVIH